MKASTVSKLQYFVGKVCTIFISGQLQRQFSERQFTEYFVGYIDWLSEDGIMTTHPLTNCQNFYSLANVVAISEEQQLDPDNPEEAAIIEEIRQRQLNPIVQETSPESPYVDNDLMAQLAEQAAELERLGYNK